MKTSLSQGNFTKTAQSSTAISVLLEFCKHMGENLSTVMPEQCPGPEFSYRFIVGKVQSQRFNVCAGKALGILHLSASTLSDKVSCPFLLENMNVLFLFLSPFPLSFPSLPPSLSYSFPSFLFCSFLSFSIFLPFLLYFLIPLPDSCLISTSPCITFSSDWE